MIYDFVKVNNNWKRTINNLKTSIFHFRDEYVSVVNQVLEWYTINKGKAFCMTNIKYECLDHKNDIFSSAFLF